MSRFVPCFFAAFLLTASAAEIKGVLLDKDCSSKAQETISSGTLGAPSIEGGMLAAEAHTRECLRAPACEKSGYGVYTSDSKFILFDAAGNRKAIEALKLSKRESDIRVEVTGQIEGNTIKVATLKLL
ncbi:MAG TPA: hypothetical protein VMB85_05535 [Bryobacteraceae bacterium]|jgi:hypothetical protein|nr:hypothetical protein [Bryobacteraceae bacterium]